MLMRIVSAICFALLLAPALAHAAVQGPAAQSQVIIRPAEIRLAVDAEQRLRVEVTDSLGRRTTPRAVRWFSLNSEIVSVDSTGIVRAVRPGTGQIAARVGDAPMAMATVTVPELPPAKLKLRADGGTDIRVGASVPLRVAAITRLGDTVAVPITYRSERPKVASVDEGGRVYARRPGWAALVASAGDVQARLSVQVVPNAGGRLKPPERYRDPRSVHARAPVGAFGIHRNGDGWGPQRVDLE